MGDCDDKKASTMRDIVRTVLSAFDRPVYWLLTIVYQLFFNVASADLFNNNTVMKFYGRIQVILGVFMMFQLAMTILRGIIQPDNFTKEKGAGSLVRRVVISIILFSLLMPINITNSGNQYNEYEKQLQTNGLLFGTLYSLQHRILSNNTLGRLVLGTSDEKSTYVSNPNSTELQTASRRFASTVLKGFYRINLIPEDDPNRVNTGTKDPATAVKNRMCKDSNSQKYIDIYNGDDVDPGEIISMVNETCYINSGVGSTIVNGINNITGLNIGGNKRYIFTYHSLIAMIVGIVFVFVLLSFTIDVAVRAVKLAVLRLLAPIPIMAYMNPQGSGDETFKAWTKTLTSTYLDLFIRLAVVYFVIYLIQDMIVYGVVMEHGTGVLGTLTFILIWIGLFIFAKQAPKFIKDILGLKGDSTGKLFGGFGEFGAAMGMVASIPGAIGSGIASARASRLADETRESFGEVPTGYSTRAVNRGKHLLAGIGGTFAGGGTGIRAAATAKDHGFRAATDAMRKRNANALDRGNNGSTLFGRIGSTASNIFTGEGRAAATERDIASWESRQKALDAIKSRVSGEMVKQDWTRGKAGKLNSSGVWEGMVDSSGNRVDGTVNYKDFMARKNAAASHNDDQFDITVYDSAGVASTRTISMIEAERNQGLILKNNEDSYIKEVVNGTQTDADLSSLIQDAEAKGGSGWNGTDFNRNRHNAISSRDDYAKSSEGIGIDIREAQRQNTINKANDTYSGDKK